ncbi:MAG: Bifunctional diguanylate cyclase/phosphodiesterase [Actinomycetota bacterium]|nr:Bifunctional diguanylate cyclase/phosphodiesterase [Actinomycetota bacterium]
MPRDQGPVILVIEHPSSFQTELAAGLHSVLEPLGIPLVVQLWGERTAQPPDTLVDLLEHFTPRAIVISSLLRGMSQENLEALLAQHRDVPSLHVFDKGGRGSLRPDNVQGMKLVAEHVVRDCGARRILVVRGVEQHPESQDRERTLRRELARLGNPVKDDDIVTGAFDRDTSYRVVREAFRRDPGIDAVIAFNDRSALGAIDAVTSLGKRVPDDVVVTGFDDEIFATFSRPSLTTVSQNLVQMGRTAGEVLLNLLSGKEVGEICLPVRLRVRGSTQRAPAGAAKTGQAGPIGQAGPDPVKPEADPSKAEILWGQMTALDAGVAMSRRLMACDTTNQVAEQLGVNLPVLGITRAFLVLRQEGPEVASGRGVLALSYFDGQHQERQAESFDIHGVLPEALKEQLSRGTLMIQPLETDESGIGYFIFEQPLQQVSFTGEILRMGLSSTIDTIRRTARLRERTQQLEHEIASRQEAQQALIHQASHDALTGLVNRVAFLGIADALISSGVGGAMVLVDLARFKDVNDVLGHAVGDALLREVASRISTLIDSRGTVCRLGGDEFAVFSPGAGDPEDGLILAREILTAVHDQYRLDGVALDVEGHIGVACAPEHAEDAGTLLQMADLAMHAAKTRRIGTALYNPDEQQRTQRRLSLLGELRRALSEREFVIHYQPVVDILRGRVSGVEALVRWAHPTRGLLPPSEFIDIAEQTGLIHDLTTYVMDQALDDCHHWLDAGLRLVVAVNLSVRRLTDVDLTLEVSQLLAWHRVPASQLVLEVTETAAMADPDRALEVLRDLRDLGVCLSVDDFGTGHASLAYLSRLPVNTLKIDRSFVLSMESDRANLTIVRSILDLARSLGLDVIAEGVETATAYNALATYGCGEAQGYWLARPCPAERIPAIVEELRRRLLNYAPVPLVPQPRRQEEPVRPLV